jgi:hypothetical protein
MYTISVSLTLDRGSVHSVSFTNGNESQICICWFMFKGRQIVSESQLVSCLIYCRDKPRDEAMAAAIYKPGMTTLLEGLFWQKLHKVFT